MLSFKVRPINAKKVSHRRNSHRVTISIDGVVSDTMLHNQFALAEAQDAAKAAKKKFTLREAAQKYHRWLARELKNEQGVVWEQFAFIVDADEAGADVIISTADSYTRNVLKAGLKAFAASTENYEPERSTGSARPGGLPPSWFDDDFDKAERFHAVTQWTISGAPHFIDTRKIVWVTDENASHMGYIVNDGIELLQLKQRFGKGYVTMRIQQRDAVIALFDEGYRRIAPKEYREATNIQHVVMPSDRIPKRLVQKIVQVLREEPDNDSTKIAMRRQHGYHEPCKIMLEDQHDNWALEEDPLQKPWELVDMGYQEAWSANLTRPAYIHINRWGEKVMIDPEIAPRSPHRKIYNKDGTTTLQEIVKPVWRTQVSGKQFVLSPLAQCDQWIYNPDSGRRENAATKRHLCKDGIVRYVKRWILMYEPKLEPVLTEEEWAEFQKEQERYYSDYDQVDYSQLFSDEEWAEITAKAA